MKRIFTFMIMAAAMLASGLGAQDRWTLYGEGVTASGTMYFYLDASNIRYRASNIYSNDYASVWIKRLEPSGTFDIEHLEQHYSTRQYRLLSSARYDAKGNLISSINAVTEWDDIIPDSVGDTLFHRLWRVEN